MANTVSLLSYANTFGDWMVSTNALVRENNNLAANNYIKSTGTLYLNDPSLGLQVSKDAIIAGQLQVQGVGSSAYIQNNLRVDTQVYFQNTILGLTNSGELISNGKISASGSGVGLAVANNTTIGGNLTVGGNESVNGYLNVTGNSSITGATALGNTLSVVAAASMGSTLAVTNNITGGNNLSILGDTSSSNFNAVNASNTRTLLVRNGAVVVGDLSVSSNSFQNNITANSTIYTPILNTTNYATVNGLTSNTIVRATTTNISGTEYVDTIVANTSITVPTLSVTTGFNACNATLSANSITVGTGGLSVIGNFTINGTTVYNTPSFTLSASTPNQTAYINVYRTSTPAGNASIKWDQSNTYWSIANVAGSTPTYYRILTTQQLTDSTYTSSSLIAPSAAATNYLQNVANTTNTTILTSVSDLQSQISSNVLSLQAQIASNVSIISGIDATQNTFMAATDGKMQNAFNRANTGTFNGTTGQAIAVNGIITYASNNGVVVSGTANTLYINDPQDLRTTASPTFNALSLSNPLAISQGGTGTTNSGQALTNLLPTGTTAGYVLTTSGPGSFYWAQVSSTGATPGTAIQSNRLTYTATGSTSAYNTPVYVPGASQLRTYIDGIRQFASEYTETSGNTGGVGIVTFTSAPPAGSTILIEVDGYYVNPTYANNVAFTVNSAISPTANTIQLAIDGLASTVAFKSGSTFTAPIMAPTAAFTVANTQVATTGFVSGFANSGITFAHNIGGSAGSVVSPLTMNNGGSGAVSGTTYNGSAAQTISYNSIGASPLAGSSSLTTLGTISSGIWQGSSIATTYTAAKVTDVQQGTGVTVNATTGSVTVSIGQAVATSSAVTFGSLNVGSATGSTTGQIRASDNITAYYSSDKKFKENIEDIPNALDAVDVIGGKLFDWTDAYLEAHGGEDEYFNQKHDFGVIAQDVQSVFPRAVRTRPDGTLAVDYEKLVALSFAAIKELKAEIDILKGSK